MTEPPGDVLAACDLDRTLIYSRTCWELSDGQPIPDLVCVEHLRGRPQSFVTGRAAEGLRTLASQALVVHTTTRTQAQWARVRMPGPVPRYAIVANGGVLLVDGRPDQAWRATVQACLARSSCRPSELRRRLARLPHSLRALTWVTADDLFYYAVVDSRPAPELLAELASAVESRGWRVAVQGRKLYLLPVPLTKEAAVAALVARLGATRIVAAGDSWLDAGMLAYADCAVRPAHGELADHDWRRPHVDVTAGRGVHGGEEVVTWLLRSTAPEPGRLNRGG